LKCFCFKLPLRERVSDTNFAIGALVHRQFPQNFGFSRILPFSFDVPNGLPRSFGTESHLASPSTVAKRLGVLSHIDRPGGVRPPTGKPFQLMKQIQVNSIQPNSIESNSKQMQNVCAFDKVCNKTNATFFNCCQLLQIQFNHMH